MEKNDNEVKNKVTKWAAALIITVLIQGLLWQSRTRLQNGLAEPYTGNSELETMALSIISYGLLVFGIIAFAKIVQSSISKPKK